MRIFVGMDLMYISAEVVKPLKNVVDKITCKTVQKVSTKLERKWMFERTILDFAV